MDESQRLQLSRGNSDPDIPRYKKLRIPCETPRNYVKCLQVFLNLHDSYIGHMLMANLRRKD